MPLYRAVMAADGVGSMTPGRRRGTLGGQRDPVAGALDVADQGCEEQR
jgi:hypothetical protein